MLDKKRYLTRGIDAEIPAEIQLVMWVIIDNRNAIGAELDYLQIFQLSPQGRELKVIHSQEKTRAHQ